MATPLHDIRTGFRSLRRTPGFALAAILTLALGIGLSTAVFTVADALLIRPLPVHEQDRIVALWGAKRDGSFDNFPLELREARELARSARSLERVAFTTYEGAWPTPVVGQNGDGITRLRRALVSGEFFAVLGAQPVLGRALRAEDDALGAPVVVVLTHAAWRRQFGGDPDIVGRQIVMHENGAAVTIVGVMPQGLEYPRGVELWAPLVPTRTIPGTDSIFAHVNLIGRLAPGVTHDMARDEMTAWFERPGAPAWAKDVRGVAHALPRLILGDTKPAIIAFIAASGLLLLITCINVANLLMVRGLSRVREIAVRSALGAGRGRVVWQLMVENALLAIAGGAAGLAIAAAGVRSYTAFAAATARVDGIQLNASALAGAIGITAVAMLVFGVAPAVMTSRVELQSVLRSGTRTSAGRRSRLVTEGLVAGQIALALLVLSAAGLIARSLIKLERAELAFEPSRLLIGELGLRYDQFADAAKQYALLERLVPRIEAIPGVRAVSPVVAVPFSGSGGWDGKPSSEGQSAAEAAGNPMINMEVVDPAYFTTLGLPVIRGRPFTDADRSDATSVVMLSESAARHYWPNDDPLGKRLMMGPDRPLTVVGIVPDTRYRDLRVARPSIYFPMRQSFFPFAPLNLAIRTTGPPADLVPAIRRAITETAPGVALVSAAPFPVFLDAPLAQPRLNALLLGVFAGAAVILAAVGLFAVMMTMVRQRTRELGVRMALGATARDLREMVMRRGLAIAATGAVVGLLGALLANRLLASMLYEVAPTDATTLLGVTVLLLGIAALASFVPARSGARIDPMEALRAES